MIRLVACDIDGTLLHNGAAAIAPAIFTEIARLREKGILFCPASGRQYGSLRGLFAPVSDTLHYLCENGAIVYGPGNPGPVLHKTAMPRTAALALCGEIIAAPACELLISGANTSYLCTTQPDIVDHIRYFVGNNLVTLPSPDDVPEDIIKVSAYCRQGAAAFAPEIVPRWGEALNAAVAGELWLDFTSADKGLGLQQLCAVLDIPLTQVMAFGDNFNDIPMLDTVGHPILMETGAAELHARYPRRCRRVEDVLRTL